MGPESDLQLAGWSGDQILAGKLGGEGVRFSTLMQTGSGASPSFLYTGYPFIPRGKVAGVWP